MAEIIQLTTSLAEMRLGNPVKESYEQSLNSHHTEFINSQKLIKGV